MADADGIDLWHLENSDGGSLAKSADYILPFLDNLKKWKLPQITSFRQRNRFKFYLDKVLYDHCCITIIIYAISMNLI